MKLPFPLPWAVIACLAVLPGRGSALAGPIGMDDLQREIPALLAAGESERAESLLTQALTQQPDSPRLLAWLGAARYLNRKYLTAQEPLARAVELGQDDLGTRYYLASTLWENGHLEEAATACLAAIESHGHELPLVHLYGRLLLWRGDYLPAAEWLRSAVDSSPDSLDLWLDLAGALAGAEQVEPALQAYRKAVELAPDHYQVRYGLARMLARAGDAEAAARELAVYRQLLEEDQTRTQQEGLRQSQIDLAYDYLRQGRIEAAIAHLESLPPGIDVWIARSRAHQAAGDRQAALVALEQAVALAPGRRDLRDRLAELRMAETPE